MPNKRLERTRATLPEGYQFGRVDVHADNRTMIPWCETCGFAHPLGHPEVWYDAAPVPDATGEA